MLALAILAALPGELRSCEQPPCIDVCPGDCMMQAFVEDQELCGEGDMAVPCETRCPDRIDDHFHGTERIAQIATIVADDSGQEIVPRAESGTWELWMIRDPGIGWGYMRVEHVPWVHGVPRVVPFAAIRASSSTLETDITRMSAYQYVSTIRGGCIIDKTIAWSWTLRGRDDELFAKDLRAAIKVVDLRGDCPPGSYPLPGHVERLEGALYRPDG